MKIVGKNYVLMSKIADQAKRASCLVLVAGMLSNTLAFSVPKASAATKPSAKISFTFDDAEASAISFAAPTLQKYGYSGVEYVSTGCVGMTTAPNTCPAEPNHAYLSWAQINTLHTTYNWEIGAHTVTHPLLATTSPEQPTKLTLAQVTKELTDSKAAIKANTGLDATAFASPYGDYEPSGTPVLSEVAKLYTSHRGFADVGYNVFPYNNYLLLDMQIQGDVTVATVKSYIDQAIAQNAWLILTFHHIVANGASTVLDDYEYNNADLDAIAAYAKSKGLAGTTVSNGISANSSNGNLLANSSFETALSATTTDKKVWSTDDVANIKQNTTGNGSYNGVANGVTNSVNLTSNTAKATHLYSPVVPVSQMPYVVQSYINIKKIDAIKGEVAFYIEEFDAAGNQILPLQYKKAWSIFNLPNPLVRMHSLEYTPSARAVTARIQLVLPTASGIQAYLDNVQWYAEDGSTTTLPGVTPVLKAGDVNGDNIINALDLSIISTNWARTGATAAQGDLNADGVVNALDLSILSTNWGK